MRRFSSIVPCVCVSLAGCGAIPSVPADRTAVVSLTLLADESTHVATVSEAARADSPVPQGFAPVLAARVNLAVVDDAGIHYGLIPDAVPGRYVVTVTAARGRSYQLSGTIDQRPVSAYTRLPIRFDLVKPAADTIGSVDTSRGDAFFVYIPYQLESDGVAEVEARTSSDSVFEGSARLAATTGEFPVRRSPRVRQVTFVAYNSDAAEWLLRATPRGNVIGAFGGFGGGIAVQRSVFTP